MIVTLLGTIREPITIKYALLGAPQYLQKRIGALVASIPDSADLDRILRYEHSTQRQLDREITQLERLQSKRKGEFVPPPRRCRRRLGFGRCNDLAKRTHDVLCSNTDSQ